MSRTRPRLKRRPRSSSSTASAATAIAARRAGSRSRLRRGARRRARRRRREDDPQAARGHDAAAPARGGPTRPTLNALADVARNARSTRRPRSTRIRAGGRSSGSIARNTRARCATCSTSTSTSARSCRPTRSATASTTSPTCRASRRRCSKAICARRARSAALARRRSQRERRRERPTRCRGPQSQMRHVDGTPLGTRGGISVVHTFPADGEYTFRVMLHGTPDGRAVRQHVSRSEQTRDLDQRRARRALDINSEHERNGHDGPERSRRRAIHVKAGPQRVAAAFIQQFDGPVDDLIAPIDYTLADTEIGDSVGITALPHLRDFSITGPFTVTGVSDTPSRRRDLRRAGRRRPAEEAPCARQHRRAAREPGVSRVRQRRGRRGADEVLRRRPQGRATSKPASSPRCRRSWRARISCSASRRCRRRVTPGPELPDQRPRSGVAAVVLPLGHGPGRRSC